jgi:hypothetical protein
MSQLALYDIEWDAFPCHLDGVSVAQLVRSETPPYAGLRRGSSKCNSHLRARPGPATGWAVDHTEERSNRE